MCGRFVMVSPFYVIAETFKVGEIPQNFHPSYNISPGRPVYAVIHRGRDGGNRLVRFRWGLVPSWAKDPSAGNRMINARAESAADKPSFKEAFRKRRCLIVADGFYEWRKAAGTRIPFFVRLRSGRPFGFAGLYEAWVSPGGEILRTCTIMTTRANELLQSVHDRMPVIVPEDRMAVWLDPATRSKEALLKILKPYPSEELEIYEVSAAVNSPLNDSPDLIRPR